VYVRKDFWIVADRFETDHPRNIEVLWHWHPENKVRIEKTGLVKTMNERGNLQIIPLGNIDWKLATIKGQDTPTIQGWYSPEYNIYEPCPVSIYSTRFPKGGTYTFAWVLWPSEKELPVVHTELISENSHSMEIRVTEEGKESWNIVIPFMNSEAVKVVSKVE
jgi:hypothetical protein